MEFKITAYNVNLAVALLLVTIMGGVAYWLWACEQLPFVFALTDAVVCHLLIYGVFLLIRYSPGFYISKYLKYGVVDLQGLIITIVWVFVSRYLLCKLFKTAKI